MNKLILIFSLLFPLLGLAKVELKVGDVLLQPLKCWSCSLIEEEENSIYSHMGIVVATEPEVVVAEALGKVRILPLVTFAARTRAGGKLSVRRLVNDAAVEHLQLAQRDLLRMFQAWFEGSSYDHDFLWNNVDQSGVEKYYCSEFVTKLLQGFLGIELPLKRMHFQKNRDQWMLFFHGNPPDGKVGNSPADFSNYSEFYEVGEL